MSSGVVTALLMLTFSIVSLGQLKLSPEEKEWLSQSPVIKVANEDDWPPFDYSENGKALGLAISYVDLIAEKLGVKVEYINGYTWNELLAMSRNYELDILPCVWYTKEREEFLRFTTPYINNPQVIVVNKNNKVIEKIEDLRFKKVAFIADYASKAKILNKFPEIEAIDVKSPLEALLMVNLGKIEAYIDSLGMVSYQIDKNLLTGLRIAGQLKMKGVENLNNIHMGVRKDWPQLHSALQKAMDSITEEEKLALHDKWLMKIETETKGKFELLETEKKWLKSHKNIRFGYVENLAPIQYEGLQKKLRGITGEYLAEIENKFEHKLEVMPADNFALGLGKLKNGRIDVLSTVITKTEPDLTYTDPFLSVPVVLVTNEETALISNLETLKNKTVGFPRFSGLNKKLQEQVKLSNVTYFKNLDEGLKALEDGEIFAFCSDLATVTYKLEKLTNNSFTIAHTTNLTVDYGFAVRKDWSAMATILNRFIASTPKDKRLELEHRWFNIFKEENFKLADYWKEITVISFLIISVFLVFVFWNRSLTREIVRRQELEKSLVSARQEAEKSNQAKSDFLAMMSHEIRTPLNGILGMSQLLAETELSSEQKQQSEVIVSSGKSLLTIINDILDFSKIEAGKLNIDKYPFNLREVIESIVRLYEGNAGDRGLYLRSEISDRLFGSYKGDEGRIRQVILNLVSNAIKFTHEGGVTINVDLVESTPKIEKIKVSVSDTGIGIPVDAQKNLFNKFTQADTTTTRKYGGTGLGLAISKKIIELMDGTVSIQSTVGIGSTFDIEIQLTKSTTQVKTKVENSLDENSKNLKVLLVEDNLVNQKIAQKVLTNLGCNVKVANNGLEALQELPEFDPNIIFMDCHMPEMDGYQATREIRRDRKYLELPIIAMTANALQGDREKCLDAGMTDYLAKPFDKAKLINIVNKYSQQAS